MKEQEVIEKNHSQVESENHASVLQAKLSRCLTNYSREDAYKALVNRSEGTYLIRPSSTGDFALSIVHNGFVNHAVIKHIDGHFGFASPYSFNNLGELIEFYECKSLRRHNCDLDVVLKTPLRPKPPSIVKHIKKLFSGDIVRKKENK